MFLKTLLVLEYILSWQSSICFSNEYVDDTINNLYGPILYNIATRYFNDDHCTCVITEGSTSILNYIPKTTSLTHINYGEPPSVISNIEESNTLDFLKLSNSTQYFERLLGEAIDFGCNYFIIQVKNIKSVIYGIRRTTRRAQTRSYKKYVFIPHNDEDNLLNLKSVFSMNEMRFMPDLIIARNKQLHFTEMEEDALKYYATENSNYKNKTHYIALNSEDFSNSLKVFEITDENFSTRHKKNDDADLCRGSIRKHTAGETNLVEIVTHKFVGSDPSTEVILDIWITEEHSSGFLQCSNLFPDKTENLEGKEIDLITFNYLPFAVIILDECPPVYDGTEFLTFLEFSKKLNFTWKLILDEENFWGTVWPNGSGNGVVGMVAEDRVDIAFAAMYSWHSTFQYTDYTPAYCTSVITCLVPKPQMLPRWLALWLPFSNVMWTAVIISLLFITVAFYVLPKVSHKYLGIAIPVTYATITNSFLTTIGMFVMQAPPEPEEVNNGPMRGFITSLMVFFLLVSNAYSGGLASVLTVPRYQKPIDTPQQLVDSNLPWVNVHEAWTWSLLDSEEPLDITLVKHFQVRTEEEMKILSTQGKTAFPLEKLAGGHYSVPSHINETAIRTLRVMKDSLYGSHVIMLTRKSSPYIERLNSLISSLYETGIMTYWEGRTTRRYASERLQIAITQSVVLDTQDGPTKLLVDHLQGAFIMLGLGLALATVVFISELAGKLCKGFGSTEVKVIRSN